MKFGKKIVPFLLLISALSGTSAVCLANELSSNNISNNRPLLVDFSNYSEGLTYDLSEDGTYYIVSNNNYGLSDNNLVIPEEYNEKPVKEIASEGFAYRSWISSVAIPKTIEKIGSGAFNGTGLKEVYFNAKKCEDFRGRNWVFYPDDDTGKQNISLTIGKDVERIPSRMFFPLSTNPSIIPIVNSISFEENSSLKEIGEYAFYQLGNIKSINIPNSVTKIENYAFYGCGLESLTLPSNLEKLGKYCFANNKKLGNFDLPTSLKEIGEGCFRNCSTIEELTINSSINISKEAFKYCSSLKTLNITGVKVIDDSAFEECINLKNLTLGEGLVSINEAAFKNCVSLEKIVLPESLSDLKDQAFYGAGKVSLLEINSSNLKDLEVGNSTFYKLGNSVEKTKVVIGNKVKVIPAQLFSSSSLNNNLPNIKEIVIYGGELTQIRSWAFGFIEADVTFVGKISEWKKIEVLEGNMTLASINCVKNYGEVE